MQPRRGVAGKSAADAAVVQAGRSPQHAEGDALDPDSLARQVDAESARRSAVSEWLKQTTREVTCLLALCVVLCVGTCLFVLHAMQELLRLEMRWEVLMPFLVGRGALGLALLYLLTMAYLRYSRAVSLRAAAVLGDSVTLSSAIAAHGGYSRNLVLHSSETTEKIAGRESRSSPENAKDDANNANAP